jgi:hypothetical protein
MRITHDMLMKVAQEMVAERTQGNRAIVAAFLFGSVLDENPLLGNATDVDLFFIHDNEVDIEREIIRVTDDVHLDIVHSPRRAFRQVRELRSHPWWGPTLYGCKILYDPQHFADFLQASVRGQYDRPDHVLERSRPLAEQARKNWFSFQMGESFTDIQQVSKYLQILELAANAVSQLTGAHLTERRFLVKFSVQVAAIDRTGLMAGLMGLLNVSQFVPADLQIMIENWNMAFELAQKNAPPPELSVARRNYYAHAFDAFVSGNQPMMALWPLLRNWTHLIAFVPDNSPVRKFWQDTCFQAGLLGAGFSEKLEAVDSYLDMIDETLEHWAITNGA